MLEDVLEAFQVVLSKTRVLVGQNLKFDLNVMGCEFHRLSKQNNCKISPFWIHVPKSRLLCKLPGGRGVSLLTYPSELHEFLFDKVLKEAYNATADVEATARCFLELVRTRSFKKESYYWTMSSMLTF